MPFRYRASLALTLAGLLAAAPAAAATRAPLHRTARMPAIAPYALYSRRALLHARIILQLKLMELRSERLERVRGAIERHVPIDKLLLM